MHAHKEHIEALVRADAEAILQLKAAMAAMSPTIKGAMRRSAAAPGLASLPSGARGSAGSGADGGGGAGG
eukprot:249930-Chlamydomonas_euryale.AAC.1